MTVAVDASVVLRWLFADERSEVADAIFAQVHHTGAHAPSLLPIEVANALNVALRRQRLTDADLYQSITIVEGLAIALDEVDAHRVLHDVALLARRYELSVYDAMYLELSMRLRLPLATFDERLAMAAGRAGVSLWNADAGRAKSP